MKTENVDEKFTRREKQVMRKIMEALLEKEIATELGIDVRTVESHVKNIHRKIETRSLREIMVYVIKNKPDISDKPESKKKRGNKQNTDNKKKPESNKDTEQTN